MGHSLITGMVSSVALVFITCCETDRLTSLGQVLSIRSGTIGGAQ